MKTFQGIKHFVSWLQDTNVGYGMYKQKFVEFLLGFLAADGRTGLSEVKRV